MRYLVKTEERRAELRFTTHQGRLSGAKLSFAFEATIYQFYNWVEFNSLEALGNAQLSFNIEFLFFTQLFEHLPNRNERLVLVPISTSPCPGSTRLGCRFDKSHRQD